MICANHFCARETHITLLFCKHYQKDNLKRDTKTSFESQESCRMIKVKLGNENSFTEETVANAIKNLSTGKANVSNDIPVSIMKKAIDAYCPKLTQIMSDCLENNFFPDILKSAKITPCFEKRR